MPKTIKNFFANHGKRLLALLLTALLLFGAAVRTNASGGTSLGDLQTKRDEAQKRRDELKTQINARKQNINNLKGQISTNQAAEQDLQAQIDLANEQITVLELEIEDKIMEIEEKQDEFDTRWAGFKERMAAMQMLNDGGSIALLSSVTNLYELLTFSQTLEDMATRDQAVCQELEDECIELQHQKAELDAMIEELNQQIDELAAKREELLALIKRTQSQLSEVQQQQQADQAMLDQAEKDFQDATAAIQQYLEEQNRKHSTPDLKCSLDFGYPIAYYSYISNGYGSYGSGNWRTSPHGGSDLVAAQGTEIYAAADGIVTVSHTWDGKSKSGVESYGNYVQILHGTADDGKSYATLYAHMVKTPSVKEGQAVTKGQLIGYVGSTGNSTGSHLHLELRINNVRTDPTRYIPLP